jgi:hypothetical protein
VPQDETTRLINGVLMKVISGVAAISRGETTHPHSELFKFAFGQIPDITPLLELIQGWGAYASGLNPYDRFDGSNILTRDQHLTRGVDSTQAMMLWSLDNLGVTNFLRWNPQAETTTELTLSAIPGLSRLIKITKLDKGTSGNFRHIVTKKII